MKFKCIHCNINITDINKSVAFYQKALGLKVERTKEANDGSFILTYLGDGLSKEMGCICFENKAMGLYFINDPDDYWIEIIPKK